MLTRVQVKHDEDMRPLSADVFKRLYAYSAAHARTRNLLSMLVLARAIQMPALGWVAASIISGPIARNDRDGALQGTAAFVLLAVSTAVVFNYRMRYAREFGESMVHDLRRDIVRHVFAMPVAFFHKQRVGSLISRLTSDLEAVRTGVADVAFVSTVQVGSALFSAALMMFYDLQLFLVVLALVPVLTLLVRRAQGALIAAYRQAQENFSRVTATIAESIAGVRVTQSMGRGALNSEAFTRQIEEHGELNVHAARRAALLLPVLELNGQVFLAVLVALGGYRALHHDISFEVLVQFFFLAGNFFNPIPVLGNQYNQALTAMAGAERVFALLDTQPPWREAADVRPIARVEGRVHFERVSFGYDPGRLVLHDIELDVQPGQTVALVGHTGSGKSSMLNLVAKFYPATHGRVLVDGHDLAQVSADSLRKQVGIVTQSNFLFGGTVLDNVRLGNPNASDQEVRAAARALDVQDIIEAFPRGWDTPLGERGVGLSLGQRQIVCFTRAMLADPRILLLDEATSSVDTLAERRLQAALAKLLSGRTSFIVAHRLSTVRHADQLLVMENGQIVERGTHASLTAYESRYLKLLRSEG